MGRVTGAKPKSGFTAWASVPLDAPQYRCSAYGELQPDQDVAGDMLEVRSFPSASDCCGYCDTLSTCEGFAYLSSSGQCHLKANLSGTYPSEGVIARIKGPAYDACSEYGEQKPKTGLAGELMATKFALSPSQCCTYCSALSGCEGFSYAGELQQCYLKTKLSGTFTNPASVVRVVH
jgi:hypothetical protein